MAFFKQRSAAHGAAPAVVGIDLEAARVRARNRLVGAVVLVVGAGVLLPLAFDRSPRNLPADVQVTLVGGAQPPAWTASAPHAPSVSSSGPASVPLSAASDLVERSSLAASAAAAPAVQVSAAVVAQPLTSAAPSVSEQKTPLPPAKQAQDATAVVADAQPAKTRVQADAQRAAALLSGQAAVDPAPAGRPAQPGAVAAVGGQAQGAGGSKAVAAPRASQPADGTSTPVAAGGARWVVQVGAYAEAARVAQVRAKLERAGLKTYAQSVDTKDGRRVRVRVGPYAARAEADKAAARIKKLGLPGAVLTL